MTESGVLKGIMTTRGQNRAETAIRHARGTDDEKKIRCCSTMAGGQATTARASCVSLDTCQRQSKGEIDSLRLLQSVVRILTFP